MGSMLFRENRSRGDRIDMVDYTTMLLDGRLPKSVKAPACLDELTDWTITANALVKEMGDTVRMKFRPYIMTSSIQEECRKLEFVSQKHVEDFPEGNSHDLAVFYESKVVIVAEKFGDTQSDEKQLKSVLSVQDFCAYYMLLRRYSELMDIGRPMQSTDELSSKSLAECSICRAQGEEMVLPCMHSMCTSCADKWVKVKGDCPFCRKKYHDQKRLGKDQWQLQQWSQAPLENDICNLESRINSFWYRRGSYQSIMPGQWIPLKSSVSSSVIVPIDCVLVQ